MTTLNDKIAEAEQQLKDLYAERQAREDEVVARQQNALICFAEKLLPKLQNLLIAYSYSGTDGDPVIQVTNNQDLDTEDLSLLQPGEMLVDVSSAYEREDCVATGPVERVNESYRDSEAVVVRIAIPRSTVSNLLDELNESFGVNEDWIR